MTHEEYDLFLLLASETMEHRKQLAELERRLLDLEAARFADGVEEDLWLAQGGDGAPDPDSLYFDIEAAAALVAEAIDGVSHGENVRGTLTTALDILTEASEALAM